MRGRLFIAGVGPGTSLADALDVLTVIVMDTPGDALRKWRDGLDRAVMATRVKVGAAPDRASWGLNPEQIAATQRFMTGMGHRG